MNPLDQFLKLFSSDPKTVVIDQALTPTINYLIPFTKLQKTINISQVSWFNDTSDLIEGEVVFVINSQIKNVEILLKRIKEIGTTNVSVVLTSEFYRTFKYELESRGVYLDLLKWDQFIKDDIIPDFYHLNASVDLDRLYRYKSNDVSLIQTLLFKFLKENPRFIPNKLYHSHGECSEALYKNFNKFHEEHDGFESSGLVTNFIILERSFDLMRLVENDCNFINIIAEYSQIDINKIKGDIYFNDDLWKSLKFMNFDKVCKYLNSEAKELQINYQELKSKKGDLNIVNDLNKLENYKKLLIKYTNLCELLISEIGVNTLDSGFNKFLNELNNNQETYSEAIQSLLNLIEYEEIDPGYLTRLVFSLLIRFSIHEKDYSQLKAKVVEKYGIQWFIRLDNIRSSYTPPAKPSNLSLNLILKSVISNTAIENIKFSKMNNGRFINIGKSKENFIIVFIGGVTYSELSLIESFQKQGYEIITLSDGINQTIDRSIN